MAVHLKEKQIDTIDRYWGEWVGKLFEKNLSIGGRWCKRMRSSEKRAAPAKCQKDSSKPTICKHILMRGKKYGTVIVTGMGLALGTYIITQKKAQHFFQFPLRDRILLELIDRIWSVPWGPISSASATEAFCQSSNHPVNHMRITRDAAGLLLAQHEPGNGWIDQFANTRKTIKDWLKS